MANQEDPRSRAMEAAVVIPNVILLALVVLYVVFRSGPRVEPLVKTDRQRAAEIDRLEQTLKREPGKGSSALALAKLYSRAGEFPWALDALRSAERNGDERPSFRMKLGLGYIELGRNLEGLRVLKQALVKCRDAGPKKCSAGIKAKLEIFTRVAELLIERRIDTRKNQVAAAKVFDSVLKPASIDPKELMPPSNGAVKAASDDQAPKSKSQPAAAAKKQQQ